MSGVRVLIAPDRFSGTLTAAQAAQAIADGWHRYAADDELTLLPLSDGGAGFAEVLTGALGGTTVSVTVTDPLGRAVPGGILLVEREGIRTAYVESAQACGLHLLSDAERDPGVTTSYGVGQLLQAALGEGVTRIVVGIGDAGTNDGGAGMLAALGAGERSALGAGGLALSGLGDDALTRLPGVRERFRGVELVAAHDVDIGLLGFHGTSAAYAPAMGAGPKEAQQLEAALGRWTEVGRRAVAPVRDLLTGQELRLDRRPGAGAGGGLGYGLLLLGAQQVGGVRAVLEEVGFARHLAGSHVLVTGEGRFDADSLRGRVVSGVAEAALGAAVPTVVVAGQVQVGRRETMALGVAGSYAVADRPDRVAASMADPAGTLAALARRVAVTWSPRRA